MSLLIGLKESVSIPTGILWFSSAVLTLILGNYYIEEIQLLSSDLDQLIYILNAVTDSFVLFGFTTVILSILIYYPTDYLKSSLINYQDKNYNTVRRFKTQKRFDRIYTVSIRNLLGNLLGNFKEVLVGNKNDLKSFEYSLIQNIVNNLENKTFIFLGTLEITILGFNTDNSILILIGIFVLVFQLIDLLKYYNNVVKDTVPHLRLYYALGTDNECKSGKKELNDSVASKNWGFLKTNVEEINNNLTEFYKTYYNGVLSGINSEHSIIGRETLNKAIWKGTDSWTGSDKALTNIYDMNKYGFGYLEGKINFDVWKATQLAILYGKEYYGLFKDLKKLKDENKEFHNIKYAEISENVEIISLMEEIIKVREKYVTAFEKIKPKLGDLVVNPKIW